MLTKLPYNGYMLTVGNFEPIAVIDPRQPRVVLFKATSLDKAMRWVDAYRLGEHWAIEARYDRR